jgi:Secretion system C-terminal sorting domain
MPLTAFTKIGSEQVDGTIVIGYNSNQQRIVNNFVTLKIDQNGKLLWSTQYKGNYDIDNSHIHTFSDGNSLIMNNYSAFVTLSKINRNGEILWSIKSTDDSLRGGSRGSSFELFPNGNIGIAGANGNSTLSITTTRNLWIVDSNGVFKSSNRYSDSISDGFSWTYFYDAATLRNGDKLLMGFARNDQGFGGIYISKINDNGSINWNKNYFNSETNKPTGLFPKRMVSTKDGGVLLVGTYAYNDNNEAYSIPMLFKLDSVGNFQWIKSYVYNESKSFLTSYFAEGLEVSDGFVMIGTATVGVDSVREINGFFSKYPKNRAIIVKTDFNGNIKWTRSYSDSTMYYEGNGISLGKDSSFILVGKGRSIKNYFNNVSGFIIRTDKTGLIPNATDISCSNISLTATVFIPNIKISTPQIYRSLSIPLSATPLSRIDWQSNIQEFCQIKSNNKELSNIKKIFDFSPNPATQLIIINFLIDLENEKKIIIFDSLGKIIQSIQTKNQSVQLDVSKFLGGMYFLQVQSENKIDVKKFIICN